ncbi:MAG TPA: Rmf/CrpP family protein [Microlunatus sp.]
MISNVDRLRLMRAGRDAYQAGLSSTACPYSLTGDQARRAAVWVRGFVLARNLASETTSEPTALVFGNGRRWSVKT